MQESNNKKSVHQFVTVLKLLLSAYVCLPLLFVATTITRAHASNRMKAMAKRNFETRATRWSIINLANVSAMIIYFHTVQLQLRCITPSFSFGSSTLHTLCFYEFFLSACSLYCAKWVNSQCILYIHGEVASDTFWKIAVRWKQHCIKFDIFMLRMSIGRGEKERVNKLYVCPHSKETT